MTADVSLGDLRAERARLHAEEDVVSYVRRLAQGRYDLVRAERRRRAKRDNRDISDELPSIFGRLSTGSDRPPRDTEVPADHPLLAELERLCRTLGFDRLRDANDDELKALQDALKEYENERSREREQLFERIDALTADLVHRYQMGAPIESLLDDTEPGVSR